MNPNLKRVDFFAVLKQIAAKKRAELKARPKPAKAAAKINTPPRPRPRPAPKKDLTLGAKHFLKFIYDGNAEWSLLAIRAPRKNVTNALEKIWKVKNVLHDAPVKKTAGKNNALAPLIAIIQLKNNSWTLIYRTLYWTNTAALTEVPVAAKELSKQFKSQAIFYISEDTSGAQAYELFDRGKLVESAEWTGSEGFDNFRSTRRGEPELEEVNNEFVDDLFRGLGIYLPECYPMTQGQSSWLAVGAASAGMVTQADLLAT